MKQKKFLVCFFTLLFIASCIISNVWAMDENTSQEILVNNVSANTIHSIPVKNINNMTSNHTSTYYTDLLNNPSSNYFDWGKNIFISGVQSFAVQMVVHGCSIATGLVFRIIANKFYGPSKDEIALQQGDSLIKQAIEETKKSFKAVSKGIKNTHSTIKDMDPNSEEYKVAQQQLTEMKKIKAALLLQLNQYKMQESLAYQNKAEMLQQQGIQMIMPVLQKNGAIQSHYEPESDVKGDSIVAAETA